MVERAGAKTYAAAPSFDLIPALDGIRAIAIVLVLVSHLGLEKWVPGIFGVTLFFFVSGFLITRLLLAEIRDTGSIAIGHFYVRRILRLYPALIVLVVAGGAIYVILGASLERSDALAATFYLANYWEIFGGFNSQLASGTHPYGILWSLAVEEHFYLIFPFIVMSMGARPLPLSGLICALAIVVTAWRSYLALHCGIGQCTALNVSPGLRVLHATDTRIDSILYGALLASLLASRAAPLVLRLLQPRLAFGAGILAVLASLAIRNEMFRDTIRFTVQGSGLFLAIGSLLFSDRLGGVREILSSTVGRLVGRWSYSLYLWHWTVLMAAAPLLLPAVRQSAVHSGLTLREALVFGSVVIPVSFLAAFLSYRFVERPVLALRRRFGSHADRVDHLAPA